MKIFSSLTIVLIFNLLLGIATAGEPPAHVSLKDDVRMSTLIVIGEVDKIGIVDAKSLNFHRAKGELGDDEKAAAEIKIDRVLYSSNQEPFNSPQSHGTTVTAVFGSRGMDVPENLFKGRKLIFFLTGNFDKERNYLYPFYDWSSLCVPVDKEGEVTRFISGFEAIH